MSDSTNFQVPDDWRGEIMTKIRQLFKQADPEILEEVKYITASNPNGVLVWYKNGMISTGEIYKQHLRLAFSKGPALKKHDPKGLFNAYRAIIIKEADKLNESAFKAIIKAAVELNSDAHSSKKANRN